MCLFICVDANPQMFANIGALVTSVKNFSAICDIAIGLLKGFVGLNGLAYVTVHVFELGFKGVALSASVSIWISFVMLAIYVKYSNKFRHVHVKQPYGVQGAGTSGTPGTGGVNGTGGRSDGIGGGRAEGMDSGGKGIGGRIDGSGGKVMGGKGGKKVKPLAA
ncbi:hypothetical protein ZIOFF_020824 [Zingiber officinale]|uniref:Nodulin-like domain-containing protein n=1 Tax=Zingiber officinale TaxID=94328 RepID=A0A8J5H8P3_ZINOF|nr:hypothetical protein ZIOFF_020824 [Zingiber officinale]